MMIENHVEEKPDYSHLMPDRPAVADEDNAYTLFYEAEKSIVLTNDQKEIVRRFRQSGGAETDEVLGIIIANTNVFDAVKEGLTRPVCLQPTFHVADSDAFPNISEQIELMNLLLCKVDYERLTGDISNAVDSCAMTLAYAASRSRYPNSIVSYMVGCGIINCVLSRTAILIHDDGITEPALIRIAGELDALVDVRERLAFAARSEFAMTADYISTVHTAKLEELGFIYGMNIPKFFGGLRMPGCFFDQEETVKMLADNAAGMVSNAPLSYAEMTFFKEAEESDNPLTAFRANSIGRYLAGSTLSVANNCLERICTLELSINAFRLVTALRRYRLKHGKLPEALEKLVPDFIDALPPDPYDGKALRYNPDKTVEFEYGDEHSSSFVTITGMVYSVGKNLADEGGSTMIWKGTKPTGYWRTHGEDLVYGIDEKIKIEWAEEEIPASRRRRRR